MEEMNNEIAKIILQLQKVNAMQKQNPLELSEKDKYGYAFEPGNTYSTEPLSFTETAMRLDEEAIQLFKLIRVLNRHSPLFLQISGQLEKLVSQLGSLCITKAVMEQQHKNTPTMDGLLNTLTIDKLRRITAVNFRKSYDAFMECQASYKYCAGWIGLSIRWAALDKRLQATEEKIEQIKAGKIKVDLSEKTEAPAAPQNEQRNEQQPTEPEAKESETLKEEKTAAPLAQNGRSLPIDKTAVRDMLKQNSEEEQVPETANESVSSSSEVSSNTPREETQIEPEQISSAEEQQTEPATGEVDESANDESEAGDAEPGPGEDQNDDDSLDDEEDLPYVSEELVRRMSEYYRKREKMEWKFPQYAYVGET